MEIKDKMKNRLVKDSFLILLTNGMTYLANIVNTRLISSSFSLVDYGYRAQVLSIVAILVSIFSFGLSNCPNYFIPLANEKEKNITEKIVRNLYFIAGIICILMACIVLASFNGIVNYYKSDILYSYEIIIILMVAEQIFYSFYNGIQISTHRAIRATKTNFIRAITTVIITAIICYLSKSIYNVVFSTLIVDILFCCFTIIDSSHPKLRIDKCLDKKLIKEMLRYCVPLGISSITAGLCAQIDKLFIARLYPPEDLALYTNMCTELPLAAISGAFIAVISPYVVKLINKNKVSQAVELWDLVIELVAIILFTIIAGLFTFSKQAVFILYSEKYIQGYLLFRIFILVEITRITYFGLILRSYGKSLLILLCSASTLVLDIMLNCISYYVFNAGLIGFAIATMISTFSIQIIQLLMSCKVAKISFRDIFPWKQLGKIGLLNVCFSFVFGIIASLLRIQDSTNIILFVPLGVIWILIYYVAVKNRFTMLYRKIKDIQL